MSEDEATKAMTRPPDETWVLKNTASICSQRLLGFYLRRTPSTAVVLLGARSLCSQVIQHFITAKQAQQRDIADWENKVYMKALR